ncbi:hypothetical protein DENSPDRAFT_834141 [Dentipellis sp. KUC8613]|nr:hypothetical protein DENSPDRAFT_834141 [Dentipellis sp. KUC8613]
MTDSVLEVATPGPIPQTPASLLRSSSDSYYLNKTLPPIPQISEPIQVTRAHSEGGHLLRSNGPPPAKWRNAISHNPSLSGSDQPDAQRCMDPQLRYHKDEEVSMTEDNAWQARIKREKADIIQQMARIELDRRARLEDELRMVSAIRARREDEQKLAEKIWAQEREDKRKADRAKRREEVRQLEERRQQQQLELEGHFARIEDLRHRAEQRRIRARELADNLGRRQKIDTILLRGWVTIQSSDKPIWKRRFFTMSMGSLTCYKSDKNPACPSDVIHPGCVQSVKEWFDAGFEGLQFVPSSFAVVLKNDGGHICFYADSEDDKDILMGFFISSQCSDST